MYLRGAVVTWKCFALLAVLLAYGIYEMYYFEVDPEEFAVVHRQTIDSNPEEFFNFITETHILERVIFSHFNYIFNYFSLFILIHESRLKNH